MGWVRRHFPFTPEQSVNILGEFGPLITMFVVNAMYGVNIGTWALIVSTGLAIAVMFAVLGRPPVFPLIASTVTIVFGLLTIVTGNPMWVQIKVTIFNAAFALFLLVGLFLKKNFFQFVFEKTFYYTQEGWDNFTKSFAWFFIFTAVANETVRLTFKDTQIYDVFGYKMTGLNVWILFKIALIMPLSGVYAWFLTRLMQKHRLPDPSTVRQDVPAVARDRAAAPASAPMAGTSGERAPSSPPAAHH